MHHCSSGKAVCIVIHLNYLPLITEVPAHSPIEVLTKPVLSPALDQCLKCTLINGEIIKALSGLPKAVITISNPLTLSSELFVFTLTVAEAGDSTDSVDV